MQGIQQLWIPAMLEPQQSVILLNTILAISGVLIFTVYAVIRFSAENTAAITPRGCRRIGLPKGQSNLHDEYDPKNSSGFSESSTDERGCPAWRIKALFTYPIKSCKGIELDESGIVPTGFAFDRQFCFAELDEKGNWIARTLRNRGFNRLALVRPEIWVPDATMQGYRSDLEEVRSGGVMLVYYPRPNPYRGLGWHAVHSAVFQMGLHFGLIAREGSFTVPLCQPSGSENMKLDSGVPRERVKIWKDNPLAYNYGQYIPSSFHDFLNEGFPNFNLASRITANSSHRRITLFRVNPTHTRKIYRNAPRKQEIGFQPQTGFADAYPIHIISLSSVRDVNARCAEDIPDLSVRRFRANIIVQGPKAFEEDDWKVIRISPATAKKKAPKEDDEGDSAEQALIMYTACRTVRCKLPNVDPDTGTRHPSEPDRTLKSYRRIDKGDLTNACLGMQAVPAVEGALLILMINGSECVLDTFLFPSCC
ncbi:MOSC domain protein [Aspergillus nidulans FGSC A4]|uniref:MOSC domain protein (AFU_orthologue AFUA_7G05900) n=1 Tax=Emericella nidulans (strain FGSC A4 / ATCC 38163 / CBS 112.46 / NRRL 194 / M139) TaxID=227321 RepID=C8V1W8_EMENI|nr:hypothetical protein [Aspergillus nidulans FGSC A4]CBF71343.1 TPA: MOSC domain protein (AFU_orthologue; AFUA_7G05900) [Aspergillus nidulans FGSC A4]